MQEAFPDLEDNNPAALPGSGAAVLQVKLLRSSALLCPGLN